jgi:hypothetical protein
MMGITERFRDCISRKGAEIWTKRADLQPGRETSDNFLVENPPGEPSYAR